MFRSMKKDNWKHLFHQSLSGFLSLAMAILFCFILLRFSYIRGLFRWIKGILMPFIYGSIFAYLLRSPTNFFLRHLENLIPAKGKKLAGPLSVLLVMALAIGGIYLILSIVIPQLVDSIIQLSVQLQEHIPILINRISTATLFHENHALQEYVTNTLNSAYAYFQEWTSSELLPSLGTMLNGLTTTVGSIFSVVYNLLIGLIVCVYLLLGRKNFARQAKAILYAIFKPELADRIMTELDFVDDTFRGFFAGKILDSAIIGLICYVFCVIMSFIMGFPNPLLIAVIIGLTNVIPYFGPFIGAIPCALLILMSSGKACLIFVIFIIVLQQFDGNFLGPKLLSGSVGLPGFWVLFSISIFGGMYGFMGILVGVPIFAVIYHFARRLVVKGLERHGRLDILAGKQATPDPPQAKGPKEETENAPEEKGKP